jgi:hypothetical protein
MLLQGVYECVLMYLELIAMAKDRGLKNRTPLSTNIDKELSRKLDTLSETTMVPKSKLLDCAIKLLLQEYGNK